MASNRDETLRQFCDVTGADEDRSKFFLESSNWQLEMALSSFYEHGGNLEDIPPAPVNPEPIPVLSDSDMESPAGSPVLPTKMDKKAKNAANQRFATLSSLQNESSSDEEEATCSKLCKKAKRPKPVSPRNSEGSIESQLREKQIEIERLTREIERLLIENAALRCEADKKKYEKAGQAFYAGGSERSGQQIIGPGKNRRDIVSEMFKSVRERGAVVFEDEHQSSSSRGGGPFGGTGYRLGQTADDHEPVASGNPQSQEARSVRLRLYREGFSVDGGALRRYDDPENADFLNCVRRGEIPRELSHGGAEVRVSLEDRRLEPAPGARPARAFHGKGQLLGSPTPAIVGAAATPATPAAPAAPAADPDAAQRRAQAATQLDEAAPATTIQFRLADGSRLTGRFNHSHSVGALRRFVLTAAPRYDQLSFVLQTTFPSAELADPDVTLAEAGLLNSVVVQRLK